MDLTANPDIDIAGIMALAVSIKMNHSVHVLDVNVQVSNQFAIYYIYLCTYIDVENTFVLKA